MDLMRHGEYLARIGYDEEADSFFGEVINIRDVVTFYGRSVEELKKELAISIEAYLDLCREKGLAPAEPRSGALNLQLDPDTHAKLAHAAAGRGKSLDAWAAEILAEAAERELEAT
jgi:predicted HicB family RNase H-like nuclease